MNPALGVMKKPVMAVGGPTVSAGPVMAQEPLPKNVMQTRELLYRLVISQLFYDGYQQVAVTLSNMGEFFAQFVGNISPKAKLLIFTI